MGGVTKGAKFGLHDQDLLEWMAAQPEGDSALIKLALYRLMDERLRGEQLPSKISVEPVESSANPTPPFNMGEFVDALADALVSALPTTTAPASLDLAALSQSIVQGMSLANAALADQLAQSVAAAVREGLQGVVIVPTDTEPLPLSIDRNQALLEDMLAGLDSLQ